MTDKLKAEGTRDSYWVQNANYKNNWTLEKSVYVFAKNPRDDRSQLRIYGWVQEDVLNPGVIKAVIPTYFTEEGSDCQVVGTFAQVKDAMDAVLNNNHPDYSGVFI